MQFTVLTLFPEILLSYFESSIMSKAVTKGIISYDLVNIRDFAPDKHHICDDSPYGGGAGQLMLAEPLSRALDSVDARKKRVVYVTPSGRKFTQGKALELSKENELVFICGRYEGIDQRIITEYACDEISIGDYVMSSGEVAAEVVIDTVYRLIDGVISSESLEEESFSDGLLEYPQYTRPRIFRGMKVPDVLVSGNHEEIKKWRLKKRIEKTLFMRPDILAKKMEDGSFTEDEKKLLGEITGQPAPSSKKRKRNPMGSF